MSDIENLILKFQNILKNKSTTFLRKTIEKYCIDRSIPKFSFKKEKSEYYYTNFDSKYRSRTICIIKDNKHEIEFALRKKHGYYFIITLDKKRIFEIEPDILVNKENELLELYKDYKTLFDMIFEEK